MNLLHIDSSVLGDASASRVLSAEIVERWRSALPALRVQYRDLHANPLGDLTGATLSKADAAAAEESEKTLQQFLSTDVIVIGAPMYNFGIPSSLKAWIDRIAVAGRTFRYGPNGPEGLAGGKRIIVASTRGGVHAGQPTDFVEPYLRQVFAFLGIIDVEFVRAEGLALSPEHRAAAMAGALESIPRPQRLAA